MPVLKDTRETKKVTLSAIEGGEVEIYTSFLAGDVDRIYKENGPAGDMSILFTLTVLIKSWNLTNEEGELLPISRENVGLLDARDLNIIASSTNLGNDFLDKGKQDTAVSK